MKNYFRNLSCSLLFLAAYFVLTIVFELSNEVVFPVLLIPFVIVAYFISRKARKEKEEQKRKETTLYQKERVIQKGSPADNYLNALLVAMWILGACMLFGGLFMPAFVVLALAFLWTKKRIDRSKVENFEKIVTPAHWPKDCQYADYNLGLQAKMRFSGNSKDQQFYHRCKEEGIEAVSGARNEQKALLIAREMKHKDLTVEALRAAYEAGKRASEAGAAEGAKFAKDQKLSKVRIEELNVLAGAMKFYGLHGREKRIAMLQDMYDEAKKNMKNAKNMRDYAQYGMMQKEHDWAVHGGIASGIAGPAAGLVAAMNVESKNAAIREYNAQIAPYVYTLTNLYSDKASGYEAQMQHYRKDMEKTKVKLIADDDTQTVFKNLSISNMTYAVSETGAVVVEADFFLSQEYRIFDNVHPAADGVVAARLMENGEHKGTAYFVFPVDGVHRTVRLASICTKTTDPKAKYTVEYAPVDLWAIEKM